MTRAQKQHTFGVAWFAFALTLTIIIGVTGAWYAPLIVMAIGIPGLVIGLIFAALVAVSYDIKIVKGVPMHPYPELVLKLTSATVMFWLIRWFAPSEFAVNLSVTMLILQTSHYLLEKLVLHVPATPKKEA